MGLLDNFNLEDPKTLGLLHAGLSILANNGNGMNGRQAVGAGLLGGLQGMQQAQLMSQRKAQQEQEMQMRQSQQDMQAQQFGMNKSKFDAEQKQQADIDAAIAEQSRLHPELAGAFRLDPKAAIKVAWPSLGANGSDPYYTPIATENGLGSFDNRSGKFMPLNINGKPIVKSTDSPTLQGRISASKSFGENLYQPTDMQSGTIKSKSQLAIDAGSPSPSAGFPKIDKGTQRQRDLTALDMKLAEQNDMGGFGRNPALDKEIANDKMRLGISNSQSAGIRVPTKAEEAGAIEKAKFTANSQVEASTELPKVINQGEQTIKLVDDLINSKGFSTAVGLSSKLDPRNYVAGTDATDFNVRLDQLKGQQFLQAFESLKGGGQITEVEGKKATDAISRMNTALSEDEFKKAANEFKDVIRKGVDNAKLKAGSTSQPAQTGAVRKYNPKTGKIE